MENNRASEREKRKMRETEIKKNIDKVRSIE